MRQSHLDRGVYSAMGDEHVNNGPQLGMHCFLRDGWERDVVAEYMRHHVRVDPVVGLRDASIHVAVTRIMVISV